MREDYTAYYNESTPNVNCLSSPLVSRTGSASDCCALQETLYKCTDTIQYLNEVMPELKTPPQVVPVPNLEKEGGQC